MSAYSVFLGPIAAIMVTDFWIVHERKYDALALYRPDSIYRYWEGMNWRAILTFVIGVAPNMPGFINSINPSVQAGVGSHPYQFGWLLGFSSTAVLYTALSLIFPAKETFIERAILPDEIYESNEHYGVEVVEGILAEDEEMNSSLDREKGKFKSWADRLL